MRCGEPAEGESPRIVLADRETADDAAEVSDGPTTRPAAGLTWLDLGTASWDLSSFDVGGRAYLRSGLEAFVYTDRGVYRPGETVHLRAIVRNREGRAPKPFPLRWQVRRPDHRNWRGQVGMPDADG